MAVYLDNRKLNSRISLLLSHPTFNGIEIDLVAIDTSLGFSLYSSVCETVREGLSLPLTSHLHLGTSLLLDYRTFEIGKAAVGYQDRYCR